MPYEEDKLTDFDKFCDAVDNCYFCNSDDDVFCAYHQERYDKDFRDVEECWA